MILSEETKLKILEVLDSKEFMSDLYEGLDEKKRIELGQFYTPGKICIQMIEQFDCETLAGRNILDPTCGSGNLLIACLIAGADVDKLYGNEYDEVAVKLCRRRINRACDLLNKPHINNWQIHKGDATDSFCLEYFGPDYRQKLEEHYRDSFVENKDGFVMFDLFSDFKELTKEQEEFLREVD